MPGQSLDSARPMMAPSSYSEPATSINRFSTYSVSPSFASTTSTENANGMAEIKQLAQGLDRLKDQRLERQRFVASPQKTDDLSKLALGAKLDRALGRRMTTQDAVMRPKPATAALNEKTAAAAAAAASAPAAVVDRQIRAT